MIPWAHSHSNSHQISLNNPAGIHVTEVTPISDTVVDAFVNGNTVLSSATVLHAIRRNHSTMCCFSA